MFNLYETKGTQFSYIILDTDKDLCTSWFDDFDIEHLIITFNRSLPNQDYISRSATLVCSVERMEDFFDICPEWFA